MNQESAKEPIERFIASWNSRDLQAFGHCFREDGDFVNVLGQKASGRPEIIKMHEYPFKTVQSQAVLSAQRIEFRPLDERFTAADMWWKAVGSKSLEGETLHDRYGLIVFVIEDGPDGAVIVSGRNMDFTTSYGREAGGPQHPPKTERLLACPSFGNNSQSARVPAASILNTVHSRFLVVGGKRGMNMFAAHLDHRIYNRMFVVMHDKAARL